MFVITENIMKRPVLPFCFIRQVLILPSEQHSYMDIVY